MRRCGVASPTNNFWKTSVTQTNYISSEREFIRESESFKMLGKYFWFHDFMSNFREVVEAIFGSSKKFQTLRTQAYHISSWSGWSGDSKYIICFAKYLNFAKIKAIIYFAKFLNAFVKPRNLNFSRNKIIYLESPDHPLQNDIWYISVLLILWNFFELPKMA